jgi:hypothetical protein
MDKEFDLTRFIIKVLIFGALIAAFMVFTHIQNLKKLGITDLSPENLASTQSTTIISRVPKAGLMERISNHSKFGRMRLEDEDNIIYLRPGSGIGGEVITINVDLSNDVTTTYTIESKPKIDLGIVDNARNMDNIIELSKLIEIG